MKNKIRKRALLMVMVIMFGFLSSALMTASTYASFVTDNQDNALLLQDVEMYYKAAKRCLSSTSFKSYEYSFSLDGTDELRWESGKAIDSFYHLHNDVMFDDGGGGLISALDDSNTLYSEILDSKVSGTDNNGVVYCNEVNIYLELLARLGINDEEHLNSLVCNGSEPGLFKIKVGWGTSYLNESNGYSWPNGVADPENGSNCSSNLKLFQYYYTHPEEKIARNTSANASGLSFNVKFERADNAVDYFTRYLKDYYYSASDDFKPAVRNAMDYWTYYKTFDVGCARINNGNTSKPASSSSDMIRIYDASNESIYYHSLSDIDLEKEQYYAVSSKSQYNCEELAKKLSPDSRESMAANRERIKGCIDRYNSERDKYKQYYERYLALTNSARSFVKIMGDAIDGIENKSSLYKDKALFSDESKSVLDQFNEHLNGYLADFSSGIDGAAVFKNSNEAFVKAKNAMDDVLSKTIITDNGEISSTSADIANVRKALQDANAEYNRVNSITQQLQQVLGKYSIVPNTVNYDSVKGDVWDVNSDGSIACLSLDAMAEDFGALDLVNSPGIDTSYDSSDYDIDNGLIGGGEQDATCMNSGGAMSLGWIMCPVLELISKATDTIYTDFVEPNLAIQAELFSANRDNGLESAWKTFRDIANIIFVFLLLMVIISQLTGFGIDNYGIKKILPKLIIAAVMANLSYIICLLCVDVSNVVGNSLKAFFDGLSGRLSYSVPYAPTEGVGGGAITSVALLGTLFGVSAVLSNPALLLTLLLSAFSVLISIFFLFIFLSGRKAAVVVLTIISPIAFILYILPNTKRYYDRWYKLWTTMLFLYPICGLLVGGGNYVSNLLLSIGVTSDGFFESFTAMIIGIIPIFFIPQMIRDSFAALGKLGGMITGFGDRARSRIDRGLANSEAVKNAQKMGLEHNLRRKAGLDKNGQLTNRGMAMAAMADRFNFMGAKKRQAGYIAAAKKNIATEESAGAELTHALAGTGISRAQSIKNLDSLLNGPAFGEGSEGAYYGRSFLDAVGRGNISGMNSAIEAMEKSGMKPKDIAKLLRYAINSDGFKNIDKDTRSAWMRDVFQRHGNILATDFELKHFMQSGGNENGGVLGNTYGSYADGVPINVDDITPEDVLKLSSDSLAGLITSKTIDQSMAQRIMAMNPNLSADKKIMIGAVASGRILPTVTDAAQLKEDAQNLAREQSRVVSSINTGGDASIVAAWASATPQEVKFGDNSREITALENTAGGVDVVNSQLSEIHNDTSNIAGNTSNIAGNTSNIVANSEPKMVDRGKYTNGTSTWTLTRMNDGTLRDKSGNVYDQSKWTKKED